MLVSAPDARNFIVGLDAVSCETSSRLPVTAQSASTCHSCPPLTSVMPRSSID